MGPTLTDDIARPADHIAGGMDGRGREPSETPEWILDQLLTAEQGVRAATLGAAYALGDEARRGHFCSGAESKSCRRRALVEPDGTFKHSYL
jgi:predicted amidohydrolase YtcJ